MEVYISNIIMKYNDMIYIVIYIHVLHCNVCYIMLRTLYYIYNPYFKKLEVASIMRPHIRDLGSD